MRPKTYIIDIDGCVLQHIGPAGTQWDNYHKAVDGTVDVLNNLERQGHRIILMTARPHRCRRLLEENLRGEGIAYHQLLTDVTGGVRVLVNDQKPDGQASCIARNGGLEGLLEDHHCQ